MGIDEYVDDEAYPDIAIADFSHNDTWNIQVDVVSHDLSRNT